MTDWSMSAPPGWAMIVRELMADLGALDPDIRVLQVKEKFGELRCYVSSSKSEEAEKLIDAATLVSQVTCQRCGQPGVLRHKGDLFATLCDEHGEGFEKARTDPIVASLRVGPRGVESIPRRNPDRDRNE